MGFGIRIRNEEYDSGAVLYGTLSECLEDLGFHDFMRELWDRERVGDIGMSSIGSASLAISDDWIGQNGGSRRMVHVRDLMISGVL